MPVQSQSRSQAYGQSLAIPLAALRQGSSQSQGSQHTSNLTSRCAVPFAITPPQQSATANSQTQETPSIHTPSQGQSSSRWAWGRIVCSSSRINSTIALVTLGTGAYYYYGQYMLAWKTWEMGLWKDCHDRPSSANTSICIRYLNISYEELASRTVASVTSAATENITKRPSLTSSNQHATSTSQSRDYMAITASCISFVEYYGATVAMVSHVFALMYTMTDGYNLTRGATTVAFVLITTLIASIELEHGMWRTVFTAVFIVLVVFWSLSIQKDWKAYLDTTRDSKKILVWERRNVWGLLCDPLFLLTVYSVMILSVQVFPYFLLPEGVQSMIEVVDSNTSWSMVHSFAILKVGQNALLKTKDDRDLDVEAQSMQVRSVPQKLWFLEN